MRVDSGKFWVPILWTSIILSVVMLIIAAITINGTIGNNILNRYKNSLGYALSGHPEKADTSFSETSEALLAGKYLRGEFLKGTNLDSLLGRLSQFNFIYFRLNDLEKKDGRNEFFNYLTKVYPDNQVATIASSRNWQTLCEENKNFVKPILEGKAEVPPTTQAVIINKWEILAAICLIQFISFLILLLTLSFENNFIVIATTECRARNYLVQQD